MWEWIKAWWPPLAAWLQMAGGVLLGAISTFDFSIFALGTPTKEQLIYAAVLFAQGLITEIARRTPTDA